MTREKRLNDWKRSNLPAQHITWSLVSEWCASANHGPRKGGGGAWMIWRTFFFFFFFSHSCAMWWHVGRDEDHMPYFRAPAKAGQVPCHAGPRNVIGRAPANVVRGWIPRVWIDDVCVVALFAACRE